MRTAPDPAEEQLNNIGVQEPSNTMISRSSALYCGTVSSTAKEQPIPVTQEPFGSSINNTMLPEDILLVPGAPGDGGQGNDGRALLFAQYIVSALEERHNTSHGSAAGNDCSETAALVKIMLQRMQEQEYAIQQLQDTVRSQHDTLQDMMTTINAGFAAVLANTSQQQVAGSAPGASSIFPENSHSFRLATDSMSASFNNCREAHAAVVTSKYAGHVNKNDPCKPLADDVSMRLPQLQAPWSPQPVKTSSQERETQLFPQRAYSSEVNSSCMSKSAGEHTHPTTATYSSHSQQTMGERSRGKLLDDDGDDDSQASCDHHKHHDFCSDAHPRSTSGREGVTLELPACRPSRAGRHSFVSRDTMPCQPIYVPSPSTNFSANRMPTRLARATSAPMGRLNGRRATSEGSKTGAPRMPPRLPPRWPTREDNALDLSTENVQGTMEDPKSEKETTAGKEVTDQDGTSLAGFEPVKMVRNFTSSSTGTAKSLPRMPTRYCSISDGLDATAFLKDGAEDREDYGVPAATQIQTSVTGRSSCCDFNDDDYDDDDASEEQVQCGLRTTSPAKSPSRLGSLDQHEVPASSLGLESTHPSLSRSSERSKHIQPVQSYVASIMDRDERARTGSSGLKHDIIALKGFQHLHVSCLTLDCALVDEVDDY
jgi:hypothetical protein